MILDGRNIADFIKERHFRTSRSLTPPAKLVIINVSQDPAVSAYIRAKRAYAQDIGVAVEVVTPKPKTTTLLAEIKKLNTDDSVDGILVQLPLPAAIDTYAVLSAVSPSKDVDGLAPDSDFDPGTPTAILWLLASHAIAIRDKVCVVVGQGRLVGAPLARILADSGAQVIVCDEHTPDLAAECRKADILISATGQKHLIKPAMVKDGAVVIDAGQEADPALAASDRLKVSPQTGGLGPVTVAVLFEHLLRAAATRRAAS